LFHFILLIGFLSKNSITRTNIAAFLVGGRTIGLKAGIFLEGFVPFFVKLPLPMEVPLGIRRSRRDMVFWQGEFVPKMLNLRYWNGGALLVLETITVDVEQLFT
jgi:hypothetical protein